MIELCLLCWSFGFTTRYLCYGPLIIYTKTEDEDENETEYSDVYWTADYRGVRFMVFRGLLLGIDISFSAVMLLIGPFGMQINWRREPVD